MDRAQGIAGRHDADPGDQRIEDVKPRPAELDVAALMQDGPQPAGGAEIGRNGTVEEVVTGDQRKPEACNRGARQPDKPGQHDHRCADRPDHPRHQRGEARIERPADANDGEFENDQPEAAGQQEAADLGGGPALRAIEPGRNPGQKDEHRRTVMRDPAGEEQCGVGDVARIGAARTEEVAGMVERHQDHHQTAQQIDGIQPRNGSGRC
jgi:hypothetical protein